MDEDMESMSPVTEMGMEDDDMVSDAPSSVANSSGLHIPNHPLHAVSYSCDYPACNAVNF